MRSSEIRGCQLIKYRWRVKIRRAGIKYQHVFQILFCELKEDWLRLEDFFYLGENRVKSHIKASQKDNSCKNLDGYSVEYHREESNALSDFFSFL